MVSPIFGNNWNSTQATTPEMNAPGVVLPDRCRSRTLGQPVRRRARVQRYRLTRNVVEAALMLLVVALAIVAVGASIGERVLRPKSFPVIAVEVQTGDTLWSIADRYGYPSEYILKRVDRLATFNNLPAGARLQPGQVLQVPVENPAEQQRILASNGSTQ